MSAPRSKLLWWSVALIGAALLLRTAPAAAKTIAGVLGVTRGLRNRNPTNLRYVESIQWQGQVGQDADGYAIFGTDADGLRAGFLNLYTGFSRYGANTTRKAVSRWAPSNENDTEAYIADVSGQLGVDPDAVLTYAESALPLIRAIVRHENGVQPYTDEQLSAARAAAGK